MNEKKFMQKIITKLRVMIFKYENVIIASASFTTALARNKIK